MNNEDIYEVLNEFMLNSDYEEYNTVVEEEKLKNTISSIQKGEIKDVDKVYIYKEEIDLIKKVGKLQKQKILFSFLIFLKILKQKRGSEKNIINSSNDIDVFNEAKTSMKTEDRDYLISELSDLGYLNKITFRDKFTNSPIRCYELLYIKEETPENPVEMIIDDFRELGLQWMEYNKDKKIKCCEVCGIRFKPKSNRQKMCKQCSDDKIREYDRNRKK